MYFLLIKKPFFQPVFLPKIPIKHLRNHNRPIHGLKKTLKTIIFKPGPVQGPGSGFWLVHQVGWVNPYLKKNSKRRRFSKKKVIGLQPSFWPGFAGSTESSGQPRRVGRVTSGHDFSYIFINPAWFQPRVNPPSRAEFQNYAKNRTQPEIKNQPELRYVFSRTFKVQNT